MVEKRLLSENTVARAFLEEGDEVDERYVPLKSDSRNQLGGTAEGTQGADVLISGALERRLGLNDSVQLEKKPAALEL